MERKKLTVKQGDTFPVQATDKNGNDSFHEATVAGVNAAMTVARVSMQTLRKRLYRLRPCEFDYMLVGRDRRRELSFTAYIDPNHPDTKIAVEGWQKRQAEIAAEEEARLELEAVARRDTDTKLTEIKEAGYKVTDTGTAEDAFAEGKASYVWSYQAAANLSLVKPVACVELTINHGSASSTQKFDIETAQRLIKHLQSAVTTAKLLSNKFGIQLIENPRVEQAAREAAAAAALEKAYLGIEPDKPVGEAALQAASAAVEEDDTEEGEDD